MIQKQIKKIKFVIILFLLALGIYTGWTLIFRGTDVKLYFATKDGMYLFAEERKIRGDRIEGALNELISGPLKANLSPTIPEGVELLSVKIRGGLAVVNFCEKLVTNHWGGSTGEILTIYSIVNTLCQFKEVERVQILVEGRKIETLAGHFILEESLTVNKNLIK